MGLKQSPSVHRAKEVFSFLGDRNVVGRIKNGYIVLWNATRANAGRGFGFNSLLSVPFFMENL